MMCRRPLSGGFWATPKRSRLSTPDCVGDRITGNVYSGIEPTVLSGVVMTYKKENARYTDDKHRISDEIRRFDKRLDIKVITSLLTSISVTHALSPRKPSRSPPATSKPSRCCRIRLLGSSAASYETTRCSERIALKQVRDLL